MKRVATSATAMFVGAHSNTLDRVASSDSITTMVLVLPVPAAAGCMIIDTRVMYKQIYQGVRL
jgi:hypothetical protein